MLCMIRTGVIILLTCNRKRSFRKVGVALKRAVQFCIFWFFYFFWFFLKVFWFQVSSLSSYFCLIFRLIFHRCSSSLCSASASSSRSSTPISPSHYSTALLIFFLLVSASASSSSNSTQEYSSSSSSSSSAASIYHSAQLFPPHWGAPPLILVQGIFT